AVTEDLERNETWQSFRASPEYLELEQQLGLEAALTELEAATSQIPLGLDPLKVFGGRQVAVAGRFQGPDFANADWAVYGTVNWMGKLGLELLRYPGLIGLEEQGLMATVQEGGFVALEGAQLARPLYLTRIKDVGVVSTSPELVREALRLASVQF